MGEPEDGGDGESSSAGEYCSLSECIVMPDSARWPSVSSEAMILCKRKPDTGARGVVVIGARVFTRVGDSE